MELQEFRKGILEEIRALASSEGEPKSNVFVKIFCDNLVQLDVIEDYETCFIKTDLNKRKDLRMDAYSYDSLDKSLTVIIIIYNDDEEMNTLIKTEAKKVFEKAELLLEQILKGGSPNKYDISTPQYDFVEEIYKIGDEIRRIKLIIITDSIMSKTIGTFDYGSIRGIPLEYNIWDVSRFYNVFQSTDAREHLEIDFEKYLGYKIPILLANNGAEQYKSYLGVIPGNVLADIYDKYGSKLLEGNVRSFLSTKGAVNKNIRKSILTTPEMFFAYNNGIAATATNIELGKSVEGIFLLKAQNFQIVNGGQTTASLSTSRFKDKANLENIYVQMKLTEVEGAESERIIPAISRCSNSQNKVSEADFFSTSPFHIRMEQISRRVFAPGVVGAQYDTHWFYERARGQYIQEQLKMTSTQKKKFTNQNPKAQVITKTDFAKYVNSWNMIPHIVSKGAQSSFLTFANDINPKWEEKNEVYNEKYFRDIVALAILFKYVEKLVSKQLWYQNAYRANIVTYSIALFSYKLREKYKDLEFDFTKIWNRQEVPSVVTEAFIILTKEVFEDITAPGRATMNVTQWCKRELCWESIKKINVNLNNKLENLLISKSEKKQLIAEYKKEQKVINEIEYQTKVINLGEEYWKKVLKFGKDKGILSYQDTTVLQMVISLRSYKLPNHIQCKSLLDLINRLEGEGFIA